MSEKELPMIHAKVSQEIGVMVGFMALFGIVIASYGIFWHTKNKVQERKEEERKRELMDRGFGMSGHGGEKKAGAREGEERVETVRT